MQNGNSELKMSVEELRSKIDLTKKKWKNIRDTNCYAYALGLDVKAQEIMEEAYMPGFMAGYEYYPPYDYTLSNLTTGLYKDMDFLGIDIKEVDPKEQLSEEEWKIALSVLFHPSREKNPHEDRILSFHFFREINGVWVHKPGFKKRITNKDRKRKIITDIENCNIGYHKLQACYSLKLK